MIPILVGLPLLAAFAASWWLLRHPTAFTSAARTERAYEAQKRRYRGWL